MTKHIFRYGLLISLPAFCYALLAGNPARAVTNESGPTMATLTVVKHVINDNGKDKVPSDFTLTVTDASSTVQSVAGNAEGTAVTIAPGVYSVTEASDADYTTSYSADCSGTIAVGDSKTCTVTNDDIFTATTGTLIVVKKVVNDDGGDWAPSDFHLSVDFQNGDSTSTQSFSGDANGTPITLEAGAYYHVSEGEVGGYTPSFSSDCSGKLSVGETKTCTVTNDDQLLSDRGKIKIIKHVVNSHDGSRRASDFTLRLDYSAAPIWPWDVHLESVAPSTSTVSFPGNEEGTTYIIAPLYYQVTEPEVPNGYSVTYSDGCSGVMAGGASVTCTVTNSDVEVSHGGPGWSPGILEPLDFPNNSGSGTGSSGSSSSSGSSGSSSTGSSVGQGSSATTTASGTSSSDQGSGTVSSYPLGQCVISEPEAYYLTPDLERLLAYTGQGRNQSMEDWYNKSLTPRVAAEADSTDLAVVQNFVNYGTFSNLRLGQGERAGVVASYKNAYHHLPASTCDWQDVIKIAGTKFPVTTSVDQEIAGRLSFKKVYGRESGIAALKDAIAVAVMGYGIRPQQRNLEAENTAMGIFHRVYGRLPTTTADWDINRAVAYSGLAHRGMSVDLATLPERILSIDGLDTALVLAKR